MAASQGLPDLQLVFDVLRIDPAQVLAVYLLGSRMWGTYSASSDYDLFVITKGVPQRSQGRRSGARFSTSLSVKGVAVDILMSDLASFIDRVEVAKYPDLLCFLAPAACTLLEVLDVKVVRDKVVLKLESLRMEGQEVADEAWLQAHKLIEHGDVRRGKKVLGHSLRILKLYCHLADATEGNSSCVGLRQVSIDVTDFNDTQAELNCIFSRSWEEYESLFGLQRQALLVTLLGEGLHASSYHGKPASNCCQNTSTDSADVAVVAEHDQINMNSSCTRPVPDFKRGSDRERHMCVQSLLQHPESWEHVSDAAFAKHAKTDGKTIRRSEITCFCEEMCSLLDVTPPKPQKIAAVLAKYEKSGSGIGLQEFKDFYVVFLRSLQKQHDQGHVCIFLDVDGVLLPFGGSDETPDIPRRCLDALARLLNQIALENEAPARIVLSSTWRCVPEQVEHLRNHFQVYGEPLASASCFADMTRPDLHSNRLEEVADWLDSHPNVQTFLVLDDDVPLPIPPGSFQNRIVRPDSQKGLTDEDVEYGIVLLQQQRGFQKAHK